MSRRLLALQNALDADRYIIPSRSEADAFGVGPDRNALSSRGSH